MSRSPAELASTSSGGIDLRKTGQGESRRRRPSKRECAETEVSRNVLTASWGATGRIAGRDAGFEHDFGRAILQVSHRSRRERVPRKVDEQSSAQLPISAIIPRRTAAAPTAPMTRSATCIGTSHSRRGADGAHAHGRVRFRQTPRFTGVLWYPTLGSQSHCCFWTRFGRNSRHLPSLSTAQPRRSIAD